MCLCSHPEMSTPAPISPLSCPKCEHAFRSVPGGDHGDLRPFLIPTCGHTVCGACASAQAVALSKERSGIFLACPMCGEGASGDAMLNSLISFATEAKYPGKQAGPAHVLCKYCFSDGCVVPATHVCIDCNGEDRASCDDHAIPHRKRAHASLVPVSEYKGVLLSASDAASVSTMCVSHSDYKLDRFCLKCETLVCAECCLTSHPLSHHIVRDVASVSDTLRSQLSDLMTEARAVADTTAARAAAVAEACAGMTEDFNASRESFKTWIEASVAALRSLESDVIEAGQAALRSKTNTLRAQSRALSVSSLQLLEMLSLIGEADVGDPAHVANVYSLLKRVVAGTSAKLFTGPAVSPVVRIGFDPSLVTSALEYCAWIVKDDRANCVSVDSRVAAAMVGLSTAVESCSAASKAAMEVLSRVTGTASKVMSDLAGVREAFTAKVDRVKTAIDVAAAAALCELNGVAEDRLALLGQQEKEVRQACGRLGLAACEGKAAVPLHC